MPGDPLLESGGKAPALFGNGSGFSPVQLREVDSPAELPGGLQCEVACYEHRLELCTREFGRLKELLLNVNINYWQEPEILLLIIVKTSTRNLSLLFS